MKQGIVGENGVQAYIYEKWSKMKRKIQIVQKVQKMKKNGKNHVKEEEKLPIWKKNEENRWRGKGLNQGSNERKKKV